MQISAMRIVDKQRHIMCGANGGKACDIKDIAEIIRRCYKDRKSRRSRVLQSVRKLIW